MIFFLLRFRSCSLEALCRGDQRDSFRSMEVCLSVLRVVPVCAKPQRELWHTSLWWHEAEFFEMMSLFHLPIAHREIIWVFFVCFFFLLAVRLWKGFPVTQADFFLIYGFLITLPSSGAHAKLLWGTLSLSRRAGMMEARPSVGIMRQTKKPLWFGLSFPVCTNHCCLCRNLSSQTGEVSGEAGINQNPITEGLLWAGNAPKEWPGICLCWVSAPANSITSLGKHVLRVSLGCAFCWATFYQFLCVFLVRKSLLHTYYRVLVLECCCSSGGFFKHCLTSFAPKRLPFGLCTEQNARWQMSLSSDEISYWNPGRDFTYNNVSAILPGAILERPHLWSAVLSANCWGIHLCALTLGRVMGGLRCLWRK